MSTAIIHTREQGGQGYTARAQGYGLTSHCTSDPQRAIERVALKCKHFPAKPDVSKMDFAASGIRLQRIASQTYQATWEDA